MSSSPNPNPASPSASPPPPPAAAPAAGSAAAASAAPAANGKPSAVQIENFAPIACGATVVRDSAGKLAGRIQAQIAPQGLILYPQAGEPTVVRPGTSVKYLGENRLVVNMPEPSGTAPREISLRLRRGLSNKNLLTLDTVAFLNGDIGKLAPDYSVPFWLFLPALLPLGLPLLVYFKLVDEKHTAQDRMFELLGAAGAGVLIAALCFFIALSEKTKPFIRLLACLLFTGLAYVFTGALVGSVQVPDLYATVFGVPTDPTPQWQPHDVKEAKCSIWAPEPPQKREDRERALSADEKAKFVHWSVEDPEAIYHLFAAPIPQALRESYLKDRALLEAQFKEDFPAAANIEFNPRQELPTQRDEARNDVFGCGITAKLPGGEEIVRHIYVLKDWLYIITFQAKGEKYLRGKKENFLGGLKRDGFISKRDPPGFGAGGGGGGGGGGGRNLSQSRDTRPTRPRRGGGFGGDAEAAPTGPAASAPAPSAPSTPAEPKASEAKPADSKAGDGKPAESKAPPKAN